MYLIGKKLYRIGPYSCKCYLYSILVPTQSPHRVPLKSLGSCFSDSAVVELKLSCFGETMENGMPHPILSKCSNIGSPVYTVGGKMADIGPILTIRSTVKMSFIYRYDAILTRSIWRNLPNEERAISYDKENDLVDLIFLKNWWNDIVYIICYIKEETNLTWRSSY